MEKTRDPFLYSLAVWLTAVLIAPVFIIFFTNDKIYGSWDMLIIFYVTAGFYSLFSLLLFCIVSYFVFKKINTKINKRIVLAVSAICISLITFFIVGDFDTGFIFTEICLWYTIIVCSSSLIYRI